MCNFFSPGFYLWDIDLTYCVRQHPEEIMMMQKEALCTLFKQTPYNLLSIYGFCANKNSSTIITSETCGKEKMLSVGSSSLRWFDDQTYIHVAPSSEKGTPVGSSQDNVGFKKKYKDSFGFKVSKEIATGINILILQFSIILLHCSVLLNSSIFNETTYFFHYRRVDLIRTSFPRLVFLF